MKIIAFYLPQFHVFPENEQWWGMGFTEWYNVKSACPVFDGHIQPRIPLNNNYYDLLMPDTLRWQVKLAKEYGVYGFCYYHYWFGGKMLMEKPMENMLADKTIDFPFCISWANEDWTRAWAQKNKEVLIRQTYGDEEEWKQHFNYLLQFFRDDRYIKENGKPIVIIYRAELITCLKEMLLKWKEYAKEAGFPGLCIIYQCAGYDHRKDRGGYLFDYGIEYQPNTVRISQRKTLTMIIKKARHVISDRLHIPQKLGSSIAYSYDDTWRRILCMKPRDEKMIPGAYVNWDNTPRHKQHGSLDYGYSSQKFKRYLVAQIKRAKDIYKKNYIFLFAWNEWGEGGYLEPDEQEGYARLNALKEALIETGEFE